MDLMEVMSRKSNNHDTNSFKRSQNTHKKKHPASWFLNFDWPIMQMECCFVRPEHPCAGCTCDLARVHDGCPPPGSCIQRFKESRKNHGSLVKDLEGFESGQFIGISKPE